MQVHLISYVYHCLFISRCVKQNKMGKKLKKQIDLSRYIYILLKHEQNNNKKEGSHEF